MGCRYLCCLLLVVGCAPKLADPEGLSTTSDTSDTSDTTAGEPTTGPGETCDPDECFLEKFGFACVQLAIGEGIEGDPFAGTDKVVITMSYESCLVDYYMKKHPEMRADGPTDLGGKVFAGWSTRLCAEPIDGRIDCAVSSIVQNLQSGGQVPIYNMVVTYQTPNPGQLAGGTLLWGPAPREAFAECDAGDRPFVRLTGLSDVVGVDAMGEPLWRMQSFGVTPRALIDRVADDCLVLPITDL